MSEPNREPDLTRTTVGVLFLVALAVASVWVMRPFLLPLIWATTIVIATWPLLETVQRRLWGRRPLAAAVMVLLLIAVFLVPASGAIAVVLANADAIGAQIEWLRTLTLPEPPAWIAELPMFGESLAASWSRLAADGPTGLGQQLAPYARDFAEWLLSQLGRFGMLLVDFLLTTVLAAILYARGEIAGGAVRRFAGRLAGPRGEAATDLAGRAIRGVALGVVITALIQAVVGGLGLLVTGIPMVGLLTAAMFLLSIAQLGAAPVMALASVGLFLDGSVGAGIVLAVWTVVVGGMDNVIRPLLIRRGVELPLLLIFAGVVGGLIAFGVIGIFVGPVLLAVSYTLLRSWVGDGVPASG
jgi:predicted PurR-regulated permease PerM